MVIDSLKFWQHHPEHLPDSMWDHCVVWNIDSYVGLNSVFLWTVYHNMYRSKYWYVDVLHVVLMTLWFDIHVRRCDKKFPYLIQCIRALYWWGPCIVTREVGCHGDSRWMIVLLLNRLKLGEFYNGLYTVNDDPGVKGLWPSVGGVREWLLIKGSGMIVISNTRWRRRRRGGKSRRGG